MKDTLVVANANPGGALRCRIAKELDLIEYHHPTLRVIGQCLSGLKRKRRYMSAQHPLYTSTSRYSSELEASAMHASMLRHSSMVTELWWRSPRINQKNKERMLLGPPASQKKMRQS